MNLNRIATTALVALSALSAVAQSAAPSTPVGPNGESYWFGPGPANHKVVLGSTSMTLGDRAWFEWDSAFGFTQYGNVSYASGNPTSFQVSIDAPTFITVKPYVYVDGYFGLSASVQGWGTTADLDLGFSRFYVLHNAPVFIRAFANNAFLDPGQAIGPYGFNRIDMTYSATVRPRLQSGFIGPVVRSFNFGPTAGVGSAYLDPTNDTNFFAEIDIARKATVYWNNPAGNYKAVGTVVISNF